MKIIDKIKAAQQEGRGPFFSFEFFPPRTEEVREGCVPAVAVLAAPD